MDADPGDKGVPTQNWLLWLLFKFAASLSAVAADTWKWSLPIRLAFTDEHLYHRIQL